MKKIKNVLIIFPGEGFHTVSKACLTGRQHRQWNLHCLSEQSTPRKLLDLVESPQKLIVLPDFSKRQAWEQDHQHVAEIDQLIHAAEQASHFPMSRILLIFERDLGRAYAKTQYYWPENKLARQVLRDPSIAQQMIRRMFAFADEVFKRCQPELLIGGPAGGINIVFYLLARKYRIPTASCLFSSIDSNRHHWTTDLLSFNEQLPVLYQKKIAADHVPSEPSFAEIERFRVKPELQPVYQDMWTGKHYSLSLNKIYHRVFQRALHRFIAMVKRIQVAKPKPVVAYAIDLYRSYFLSWWQRKFFHSFTAQQLSNMKYIYYSCSQEPEFVLNCRAPCWYNQANTIKMLSYHLPIGYQLLVREHRNNSGRRSNAYLRDIARLPNTVVLNPFDDQYKYLQHAALIVTVNGTAGFEAVLLKKRTLVLDSAFYDPLPMVNRLKATQDLGAMIVQILNAPAVASADEDKKIATFLDAARETTLADDADGLAEIACIEDLLLSTHPNK